jgi:hypothetical protein
MLEFHGETGKICKLKNICFNDPLQCITLTTAMLTLLTVGKLKVHRWDDLQWHGDITKFQENLSLFFKSYYGRTDK